VGPAALGETVEGGNPNRYRLERFGKAMSGSVSWEAPAAVLNGMYYLLAALSHMFLAHRSTICACFGRLLALHFFNGRLTYVIVGFDWHALPRGSVIVDVGGGIGSTTMVLANAFSRGGVSGISPGAADEGLDLGLEFVIQDRQVVVEMGVKVRRYLVGTPLWI
jgi:hypothetical protein